MESLNYLENNARDITILYVDDEHELLEKTRQLLQKLFDVVDIAHNGQEGLELYQSKQHDLVITDIKMPVMDGVDMIRGIQKIKSDQPVIVTSAYDFSDNLHPFLEHDVNTFLPKPLVLKDLLDALASLARKIKKEYRLSADETLQEEVRHLKEEVISLKEEVKNLKELMNLPPL